MRERHCSGWDLACIYVTLNALSVLYPKWRRSQHHVEPPWSFESSPVAEAMLLALEHSDRLFGDRVHVNA